MKLLVLLRSLVATLFHRSQIDGDMEEELRSHIQHRADDLERSGLPRAEAERRARIEFGGYEHFKEECHEALGGNFFETFVQDVRYRLRVLRKSPGFTIAAVLTLALAIGANAVVFSVMNAFMLRPLNVPSAESLYADLALPDDNIAHESYPDYLDLRDRNHSFEGLAAYNVDPGGAGYGREIHPAPGSRKPAGTTSTHWACSRILAVSSTPPTSMAPTALPISCSPTPIGTPIFRTIAAWWAVSCG